MPRVLLLPALLVGLALAACGPRERPASLLVVTVDTLRADRLGCYGYFRDTTPALDALAADGLLFERAVAPMATTLPSHVSLFTGTNPSRHGVLGNLRHFRQPLVARDGLPTLAEILKRAGYTTAAFVAATPLKAESGIAVGFDHFDQPKSSSRRAGAVVAKALDWLAGHGDEPFFLWLHLWDPHSPYSPPPGFGGLFRGDGEQLSDYLRERAFPDPEDAAVRRLQDAYDSEVRYADSKIGELVRGLRAHGLYEELAIVVTSDHGEGLGQHGWEFHGRIYNEQLLVPLLLKLPGSDRPRGVRRTEVVSLIDLPPTLIEALDLAVPDEARAQFEGISVLSGGPAAARDRFVFSERVARDGGWGPGRRFALTGNEWKYLHAPEGSDALYRLSTDPHEQHDLLTEEPEVARRLRGRIEELLAGYARQAPGLDASDAITDERREELRALGYMN